MFFIKDLNIFKIKIQIACLKKSSILGKVQTASGLDIILSHQSIADLIIPLLLVSCHASTVIFDKYFCRVGIYSQCC